MNAVTNYHIVFPRRLVRDCIREGLTHYTRTGTVILMYNEVLSCSLSTVAVDVILTDCRPTTHSRELSSLDFPLKRGLALAVAYPIFAQKGRGYIPLWMPRCVRRKILPQHLLFRMAK